MIETEGTKCQWILFCLFNPTPNRNLGISSQAAVITSETTVVFTGSFNKCLVGASYVSSTVLKYSYPHNGCRVRLGLLCRCWGHIRCNTGTLVLWQVGQLKFIAECSTAMEVCSGSDQCLEEYGAVSLLSAFQGVTFAFLFFTSSLCSCHLF